MKIIRGKKISKPDEIPHKPDVTVYCTVCGTPIKIYQRQVDWGHVMFYCPECDRDQPFTTKSFKKKDPNRLADKPLPPSFIKGKDGYYVTGGYSKAEMARAIAVIQKNSPLYERMMKMPVSVVRDPFKRAADHINVEFEIRPAKNPTKNVESFFRRALARFRLWAHLKRRKKPKSADTTIPSEETE